MAHITFWTTQNGIVGTAHTNRHGETVDFRPRGNLVKIDGFLRTMDLLPEKGVAIQPLRIPVAIVKEERRPDRDVRCERVVRVFRGEFQGVPVEGSQESTEEGISPEAREACLKWEERVKAQRRAEAWICGMTAAEWVAEVKPSHRDWGRMSSPLRGEAAFRRIHARHFMALPGLSMLELPFPDIHKGVMAIWSELRAAKAARFLASGKVA